MKKQITSLQLREANQIQWMLRKNLDMVALKDEDVAYGELSHIENIEKWKGLKSIIKIESEVYHKIEALLQIKMAIYY